MKKKEEKMDFQKWKQRTINEMLALTEDNTEQLEREFHSEFEKCYKNGMIPEETAYLLINLLNKTLVVLIYVLLRFFKLFTS